MHIFLSNDNLFQLLIFLLFDPFAEIEKIKILMKKAHCSIQIHEQCSYSNTGCDYLKCLHRSWQIKLYH
jgi:hypothetical protein